MALKKKLTKEQFAALSADLQKEYKADGESFVLDVEGDDSVDWQKKRNIEAEHREKAERKAAALQDQVDGLLRGAIPKDDVAALETSWKTKLTDAETKHAHEIAELNGVIATSTVTNVANDVAQIFLAPAAMVPMIRGRLKSEIVNGVATTRVLDKNGQPSALTVEDLKNEFKADASLAPVIVGSKASGGGAGGSGSQPGAGGKKLKDMNEQERTKLYKENPAEFKRLVDESKQQGK